MVSVGFVSCITPQLPTVPRRPAEMLTLDLVMAKTAQILHTTPAKLLSYDRRGPMAMQRHHAMWLLRQCTDLSFPRLAQLFGRDHSTIIYGCQMVDRRIAKSARIRASDGKAENRIG